MISLQILRMRVCFSLHHACAFDVTPEDITSSFPCAMLACMTYDIAISSQDLTFCFLCSTVHLPAKVQGLGFRDAFRAWLLYRSLAAYGSYRGFLI